MSDKPFAIVSLRPCGCVAEAATPEGLSDLMKTKNFCEQIKAGNFRTVATRAEWLALPWKCEKCRPEAPHGE